MPGILYPIGGRRLFWLLDIQYAGKTIRLSDGQVTPTDDFGNMYPYHGVLGEVVVKEESGILSSGTSPMNSIPMSCVFPVDVPRLVAQGHDLATATGTLSRWIEGTSWDKRKVVLMGSIRDPEYGAANEPVNFSLEATPWQDSMSIPNANQMVTGKNWDDDMILSLATDELGLYYPIIIGKPGVVNAYVDADGYVTGSQGAWVDHRRLDTTPWSGTSHRANLTLVIAGHHVTAQSVYAITSDYPDGMRFYVRNGHDRKGHPIAFLSWWATKPGDVDDFVHDPTASPYYSWAYDATNATVSSLGDKNVDSSFQPTIGQFKRVFIGWKDDDDTTRGGARGGDGKTIRGAGDVLSYLFSLSGIPVDHGRFAANRQFLNAFKLDFSVDDQCTPWEFARANLLPLLPVSIVSGDEGLYPVIWQYDAKAHKAIFHLDLTIDPMIERASAVSYDRDIVNQWTLNFARSARTGTYCGQIRIGSANDRDKDGADGSFWCDRSQARYRRPDGSPLVVPKIISTRCVYDLQTAHRILGWMSCLYAFARRRVDYILPERDYATLRIGLVVTITDPELYLNRQVALVEAIVVDGSPMMRIRLLIIDNPVRDRRLI
jgi:hypothetical protein